MNKNNNYIAKGLTSCLYKLELYKISSIELENAFRGKMNKYEYKVLSTKEILDTQILKTEGTFKIGYKSPQNTRSLINSFLNRLGEDGWELVSVRARNILGFWNSDDYILKRQKNE
jgi:hypothetical protein